ncbi:MAG: hypothetical protein IKD69_10710 [Solobacterium sp.]|nr:hypothetical protein [Solobacterium sp.]
MNEEYGKRAETWLPGGISHLVGRKPRTADECRGKVRRGRPASPNVFYYLDAAEEALCFGWIDSTWK